MKRTALAIAVFLLVPGAFSQEAKNVQLLKGMSPTQLQRTMNMMRASLGVHCDFCHLFKDDKWDFASDDKQEKKIARNMIQMTMDLNEKYFKRQGVTCNSCHRGSLHPVALASLPQTPPPFPTPPEERPALPARDEVVAKFVSALGKVDENAMSRMELIGTRESPRGKAPIDVVIAPGKIRVTSKNAEGGELINVFAGDSGWFRDPKNRGSYNASQLEHMWQVSDAMRFIMPSEIPADAKVTSKDKAGDKDAWVITMPWGTIGRQRLYFDTTSGLLLKRVMMMATPIGWVPQKTTYDDYRDVGGFKLPFVVTFDSVDPWIGATRRYNEIRLNAKIDESVFTKPSTQ